MRLFIAVGIYSIKIIIKTIIVCLTFRQHTASLHQAMRSTGFRFSYKAGCFAVIGWFSTAVESAFRSSLLMRCSLGGPLSYGSPAVVFLDHGNPQLWNSYSTTVDSFPVDVVRVKSYVNCLVNTAGVPGRIMINKLNLIPKQLVAGAVGVL